nr:zinc finger, CCHC-type [Tanacetum cinerariifolium]
MLYDGCGDLGTLAENLVRVLVLHLGKTHVRPRAEDKLNYLELPIPVAFVLAVVGLQVPPETLAAHAAWVKGQKEIVLKTLFSQQAEQELLQTVREFHAFKQEEEQSVYVLKMKSYIDNLVRLGHPMSQNLAVSLILVSMRKKYDSFVQNYNMHGIGKTVNELHAMLKLHEQILPKRDALALHAIRAGKADEYELGDLNEPINYKAALLDPETDKCLNAMNVKMQSMNDNKVWDLVNLHPNSKTVGSKWLFKKKTNMDETVHTYKAHLIEKGFTQTPRIDYEETFHVADIRVIRILIAIAVFYDYEDVKYYLGRCFAMKDLGEYAYILESRSTEIDQSGAIDWKSTKQSIFATSSAEAKYIVALDASKEAVCDRKFNSELGVVPTIEEPIKMYCNNTGAITIANESGITKGVRHYHAKVYYLPELIEFGDIKLEKVHTDDSLADPFTKALAFPKHSKYTKNIGMLPAILMINGGFQPERLAQGKENGVNILKSIDKGPFQMGTVREPLAEGTEEAPH